MIYDALKKGLGAADSLLGFASATPGDNGYCSATAHALVEPFIRLMASTSKVERKRKYKTQSAYPYAVSAAAAVNTHNASKCPFISSTVTEPV